MRISKETLIRIAKETVQKRVFSDPELVAAYLTGSLRTENPFLGSTADIDIVFVHASEPKARREIVALTPEIHLDLVHNPRSEYEKPKELRVHPWLGPEIYDPLPLYATRHFFEFVQAGVRDKYHEPANVLARARKNAEHARQIWSDLPSSQDSGPALLLPYLKSVNHAANAIAVLTSIPLAERRFLLQFPKLAEAAEVPGLVPEMEGLVGANKTDGEKLGGLLLEWQKDFLDAASRPGVDERITAPRLNYYKLAFESLLASETPQAMIWPLVLTWTLAAAALPAMYRSKWQAAMTMLGLTGVEFGDRIEDLDHFLDSVEELLENRADSQGL